MADLYAVSTLKSGHSGVTHVNLNQRFQGLEVFGGAATISVASTAGSSSPAGSFVRDLRAAGPAEAKLDALQAVEAAAAALDLAEPTDLRILDETARGPSSPAAASPMSRFRPGSAGPRRRTACASPGR